MGHWIGKCRLRPLCLSSRYLNYDLTNCWFLKDEIYWGYLQIRCPGEKLVGFMKASVNCHGKEDESLIHLCSSYYRQYSISSKMENWKLPDLSYGSVSLMTNTWKHHYKNHRSLLRKGHTVFPAFTLPPVHLVTSLPCHQFRKGFGVLSKLIH